MGYDFFFLMKLDNFHSMKEYKGIQKKAHQKQAQYNKGFQLNKMLPRKLLQKNFETKAQREA